MLQKKSMKKIKKKCEVCNLKNQFEFLNLGKQPLCDDLIKINSKKLIKNTTLNYPFVKNVLPSINLNK